VTQLCPASGTGAVNAGHRGSLHPHTQNGLMVPYITKWTGERTLRRVMVRRGAGIGFADESPYDRDDDGVLWIRQTSAQGSGEAEYLNVHSARQRQVTRGLLCQGCAVDTVEQDPQRQLFVLKDIGKPIGEGELTTAGPVCLPCAHVTRTHCPPLRRHVAAWVERPLLWGVAGILHDRGTLRPLPKESLEMVSYEDPRLPWVLAVRQVLSLNGCAAVDLGDLGARGVDAMTGLPDR